MDTVQAITLTIACIGCGLGVLNTWKTFDKERAKITVHPANAKPFGPGAAAYSNVRFSIEVVNHSAFPVIIKEVGFFFEGITKRGAVINPVVPDGKGGFPRKLDAREAASFYMEQPRRYAGRAISHAYATTADGRVFRSAKGAMDGLIE